MKFQVKKNPVLVVLILSLVPIFLSIPIISIVEGKTEGIIMSLVVFVLLLPVLIILVWALFKTYHEITDTELTSTFGFIKYNFPLNEIRTVGFSNNPISSPSWTFKRLKIEYKNYGIALLSLPKDEEMFLQEIKKHCPSATVLNRQGKEIGTTVLN
ncbi:PH domain-containing protein [Gottfriedia luciferensis]|uniref:PH domain-containing protein n=1 Tax=Gottfriedia luciferensis TaxID=178774 RepID=UPI000B4389A1|nr:PH domain-containing protein [Gottfriedia luciferensis]